MNTFEAWEKRSKEYGSRIEGVLPKSLPIPLNDYLDRFMYQQIESNLPKKRKIKILDVGCGYGRLSEKILRNFPQAEIAGLDIAKSYVDLFNTRLGPRGKAIVGSVTKLPFKSNTFDAVIVVTTLMYLTETFEQNKAMVEVFRVLKPEGILILIERNPIGYDIFTLWGIVAKLRGKKNLEISAVSFTKEDIANLIGSKGRVKYMNGIPFWTLLVHLSILISLLNPTLGRWWLKIVNYLDKLFNYLLTPSVYISYICIKEKNE